MLELIIPMVSFLYKQGLRPTVDGCRGEFVQIPDPVPSSLYDGCLTSFAIVAHFALPSVSCLKPVKLCPKGFQICCGTVK